MEQAQLMVQSALSSSAPRIYANGIGLAMTGGDMLVTLWSNGQTVAVVNLPFVVAHSLVVDLGLALKDIEEAIGHPIPTPKEVGEGLARVVQARASAATTAPQ
jgi:hypothetical protein